MEKGAGSNNYPAVKKTAAWGIESLVSNVLIGVMNRHNTYDQIFVWQKVSFGRNSIGIPGSLSMQKAPLYVLRTNQVQMLRCDCGRNYPQNVGVDL